MSTAPPGWIPNAAASDPSASSSSVPIDRTTSGGSGSGPVDWTSAASPRRRCRPVLSAPADRRQPQASPAVMRRSSPAARSIVETVAPPAWTHACGARDPASPSSDARRRIVAVRRHRRGRRSGSPGPPAARRACPRAGRRRAGRARSRSPPPAPRYRDSAIDRFRRATGSRSASYVSRSASAAYPLTTQASFQPRFAASAIAVFMPRPPKGGIRCAASPARNARPTRHVRRELGRELERHRGEQLDLEVGDAGRGPDRADRGVRAREQARRAPAAAPWPRRPSGRRDPSAGARPTPCRARRPCTAP